MSQQQILGIVVLIVGVVVRAFGINASHAPVDRIAETFTGRYTSETMMYLIGGGVAAAAGAFLLLTGRRS